MNEENRNIFNDSSNDNITEETSSAEIPDAEESVPTVEAEKVDDAAYPVNHTDSSQSEFEKQQAQYSPYGSRPYSYSQGASDSQGYSSYNPTNVSPLSDEAKPKKNGLKIFTAIVCVLLVFSLVLSGVMISKYKKLAGETDNSPSLSDGNSNADAPSLNIASTPASVEGALTTAQIAAKVKPSIVGIVVYTSNSGSSAGEGTGVIMGEDASGKSTYIVTCAHVISDAGIKVKVQTEDGTTYNAEIVGFDSRTDLGVVKIDATGLPAAEFGNSDNLRVGDSVFAIGNPGGVEFFGSFTGGYVSAIDRPVSSDIGYTMKCVQHDAAINPGNSGGALVNVYGQVIGINSQKIAATDYEGMGFAIPITSAKSIIDSLIQHGYVPNRPKLGITYYPVSASTQYSMIAQIQGLPAGTLIIDEITQDSSLYGTEARRYDMIIAVDGKELTTADVLLEKIDKGKVGDTMTLTLCRVNSNYSISKFDVTITLVEDKSGSEPVETEPQYVDPFEYFNPFGY